MPKERVSLSIDQEIKKTLEALAEKDNRSFSSYCNDVLNKHINLIKSGSLKLLKKGGT